jgi:PAS domain S-box-containing protein
MREVRAPLGAIDAEQRLAAIVDSSLDAIYSKDSQARITSWNAAAEALYGYRAEEVVGRPIELLVPADLRHDELKVMRRVMAGETVLHYETRRRRKDGQVIEVSLQASPIRDRDGRVLEVSVIARDITALQRAVSERDELLMRERRARTQAEWASGRLALLARAGKVLGDTLDPDETLHEIISLLVPEVGDLGVVDLLDARGGISGAVALAASDPASGHALEQLRTRFPLDPDGPHPVARVIASGEAVLLPELPPVLAEIAQGSEHLAFMRALRYRSALVAPLRIHGRTFGALSVLRLGAAEPYQDQDLDLLVEFAGRAAIALENSRVYQQSARVAQTLQRSLLPAALPTIAGMQVAGRYRPAGEGTEVGGDFYDMFETGRGRWAIVVGDVCGKGAEAAALTALARYTVRAAAVQTQSPAQVLWLLNEALLRHGGPATLCSAVYANLEISAVRRRLQLASGGHPLPLRLNADGQTRSIGEHGTLLGVIPDIDLPESEIRLADGDAVVFYTDGVSDAGAPADALENELPALLAGMRSLDANAIAAGVEAAAVARAEPQPRDDIALLVLKIPARWRRARGLSKRWGGGEGEYTPRYTTASEPAASGKSP